MKIFNKILSYQDFFVILTGIVYGIIKGFSIQFTILVTISLGAFLFLLRFITSKVLRTSHNYKEFDTQEKQKEKSEQEVSIKKFEVEIKDLRDLIENARSYCEEKGYDSIMTNIFIDEYCKRYIDIFLPIVAVSPDIYDLLIKERVSLKPYIMEKIREYFSNRPSESEVEKELIKTVEKIKIFTKTRNKDFNLNYFACIQVMVNKYGFSQEVFSAASKTDPELVTMVLRLYDMRLKEAQTPGVFRNINITRGNSKLGFKRERVSSHDMEMVKDIMGKYGTVGKDLRFKEWVIDKQKEHFLIKLQGDGYSDKQDVGVFAFRCKLGLVRIEAIYDVAGRSFDGCGVYWQMKKVQIPLKLKEEKDTILSNIREAFMAYGIGFDAMVQEFKLNFDCEPEFTEAFYCEKELEESHEEKPEGTQKGEPEDNIKMDKNAGKIDLQKYHDETTAF